MLPILAVIEEDMFVTIVTIEDDKPPMLDVNEEDNSVTVVATEDDIVEMFSPPLVREPVTTRLWTFIPI
jgi:hypothetical protein